MLSFIFNSRLCSVGQKHPLTSLPQCFRAVLSFHWSHGAPGLWRQQKQGRQQSNIVLPPQRWVVTFTFPPFCLPGLIHGGPGNLPLHPHSMNSTSIPLLLKPPLKVSCSAPFTQVKKGGKLPLAETQFKNTLKDIPPLTPHTHTHTL